MSQQGNTNIILEGCAWDMAARPVTGMQVRSVSLKRPALLSIVSLSAAVQIIGVSLLSLHISQGQGSRLHSIRSRPTGRELNAPANSLVPCTRRYYDACELNKTTYICTSLPGSSLTSYESPRPHALCLPGWYAWWSCKDGKYMCQCDNGKLAMNLWNASHSVGNSTSYPERLTRDSGDLGWLFPCKHVSVKHWENPFRLGASRFRSIWKRSLWRKSEVLKVVVVQTSGQDHYEALLQSSSNINRMYAALRGYDYLAVIGTISSAINSTLSDHFFSAFNKVFLLHALVADGRYDLAFYLDADALVVDFDFSPLHALNTSHVFAASRGSSDESSTWDINDGVMVWNLKHPRSRELLQAWLDRSVIAMQNGKRSDQYELQRLLERSDPVEREALFRVYVGHDVEFMNYDGPNVKHILRKNHTDWSGSEVFTRLNKISQIIAQGELRDKLEDFNGLTKLFHMLR
eukprot:768272-Hanusia_phi.AAC.17